MKIGIIIYSQTGNSLDVANRIAEACTAAGHQADLQRITIAENKNNNQPVKLVDIPDCSGYDALIFGGPVQAFSLNAPMLAYLKQLPALTTDKTAYFATQGLPKRWMGYNHSFRQASSQCKKKGAEPVSLGSVHWRTPARQDQIDAVVAAAVQFASA